MGVRVTVCVAVGGNVRVGDGVEVEVPCVVEVMETVSGVVSLEGSVRVCLSVGEGAGVLVLSLTLVWNAVDVLVGKTTSGTVEGAKI